MKKKYNYLIAILIVLTMVFVTACGSSSNQAGSQTGDSGAQTGSPNEPSDTGTTAPDVVIEVKIGSVVAETDPIHRGFTVLADALNAADSRFSAQVYPNGQLGASDDQLIQGTASNVIQVCAVTGPVIAAFSSINDYYIYDYPYLMGNNENVYKVSDSPIGAAMSEKLIEKTGIKYYGTYVMGWMKLTNNRHPITSPADMAGMKMRTIPSEIWFEFLRSCGANPIGMGWGEVMTALQQGTIDGVFTHTSIIESGRLADVQKYVSCPNPNPNVHHVMVSNAFYEGLPDDMKVKFDACIDEYLPQIRKFQEDAEIQALSNLAAAGMEVLEFTPEQRQAFVDASAYILEDFADVTGAEVVNEVRAMLGR